MSEYAPSTDVVRQAYLRPVCDSMDDAGEAFDRWLDDVKRAARAEGMRAVADWLEGGTPRAWGFHHPCDPPGVRWEPSPHERDLMYAVDATREAADRHENGANQ